MQAAIRAFIVDNAPAHQQEAANAWASRLTGIGNILGYVFGYLDLPKIFPFLGNTQFKCLCVIACLFLGTTLAISCVYIQERDPRLEGPPEEQNLGVVSFFEQVFSSIRRLPPQIKKVCEVQVCAWVGWFPFLFYITTYIGQLYVNPIFEKHPHLSDEDINEAWIEATRVGTFALLAYAVTSFIASIVLPVLVVPTYRPSLASEPDEAEEEPGSPYPYLRRRRSTSTLSITTSQGVAFPTYEETAPQPHQKETRSLLSRLQIPGLTLRRLWFLSHLLFAVCMFSTFFIYSPQAGTVVVAIVGLSWALTLWAPFALISAEIAQRDANNHQRRQHRLRQRAATISRTDFGNSDGTEDSSADYYYGEQQQSGSSDNNNNDLAANPDGNNDTVDQAGIILGIHNVAISFPQIFSTLVSSAIFNALQKPRGEPWDDSVGWVLRFGGCATLFAAWVSTRLDEGAGKKHANDTNDGV